MDGTILSQGSFIQPATAVNQYIVVPSNIDFMWTYNKTQIDTPADGIGIKYYWQRGFPAGYAIETKYETGHTAVMIDSVTSGGFTLYDPSGQSTGALPLLGAAVATTASTNATRPVVSTGSTAGVAVGTVVRMSNTAQLDVNGVDMVVGAVVTNTSITLLKASNALATAPGLIGGAGFYRIVNVDPLFYPRRRFITNITQANPAQISTSVAHGFVPGQAVRFSIPSVSGMVQLNSNQANNYQTFTVNSVVDDFNFTIVADSTGFTAFTYPTSAQEPVSPPIVSPVGEDTANALVNVNAEIATVGGVQIYNTNTGILSDSTVNTGFLGMLLPTGANSPGGVAADQVYWVAGKSTFGGL